MNRYNLLGKWTGLFLSVVFIVMMAVSASAQTKEVYTIGWEEWPPFQYRDSNGRITGLDMDLMRAILEVSNLQMAFVEVPWKRHLKEIEAGRVDLATGASKTPDREVYAYFSNSYRTGGAVLFVNKSEKSKWHFSKVSDLENTPFKLCLTRGYHYGDEIEKLKKSDKFRNNIGEVTNESQCFMMLKKGYISGFLSDAISGIANLRKENMLDDVEIILNVYSDDLFVMFSKQSVSSSFVEMFNSNLDTIKKNGIYHEIIGRYLALKKDEVAEKPKPVPVESRKKEIFSSLPEDLKKKDELLKTFNDINKTLYLQVGGLGEDIKRFQMILGGLGYYKGEINGFFSFDFAEAVRQLQKDNHIMADGIVGPLTYNAILPYLQ